jgi:hypothetical protein
MGEIKSAIELAMERTKNLVMDEKEKEQSLIQEAEQKLKGLLRRFLEGSIDSGEVLAQLGKIGLPEPTKKRLLCDATVSVFDVATDSARLFELLLLLNGDIAKDLKKDLVSLQKQFSSEMDTRKTDVRKQILGRLKTAGVSGNAVEPNLEAWEEWDQAVAETRNVFKQRLERWKEKMKAACA